jgi:hypothetical protein
MNKKGTIYFVEGLPGSGKTTISNWLHDILNASYFTENTPNYPNDFSAIAGMTTNIYTDLSKRFPILNIIMDSVWLQNPINELVFRNADEESVLEYCALFVKVFKEFNMSCIYLKRNSIVQSVEFASNVKGVSWTNRVAELISKTPYGLTHNLHGLDGMVQYFTVRKQIEEKILLQGIMRKNVYLIENSNWDQIREQIRSDFSI